MTFPPGDRSADVTHPRPVRRVALASLVSALALVALKLATALATGDLALLADAVNFKADLLTSAAVLLGLAAVKLGYKEADAIGGLVVACYVAVQAVLIGRRSIDALMDRAPQDAVRRIRGAAGAIPGVE